MTSSPSLATVRFSGTDANPIDGSIDAPWGSPQHWEGHCTTFTGWGWSDPPQAFQHLEGRVKIGSAEDFARFVAAETAKWAKVVKASGAKVD